MRLKGTIFASLSLFSSFLLAGQKSSDPPLIQIGGGAFNITKHKRSALAQVEYKWSPIVYKMRPFVGLMGTDRESLYMYGGLGFDIFFGKNFVMTPSLAPGIYFKGRGKKLWFPLEFRTSIEAAVVFGGQHRIGAQFYHMSNAGFGRKNPGAESLVFFLAIPLKSK